MSIIWYLTHVVFVFISPIFFLLIGENIICGIARVFRLSTDSFLQVDDSKQTEIPWGAVSLVLGLLAYLTIAYFLKIFGAPWALVTYLPLVLAILRPQALRKSLLRDRINPGLNFILWFVVIVCLGLSLFRATDGIQTPWTNNYGDLTFHLGMITSFVFGDNLPPEYHIMAGQKLSYPIFMNFWSSLFWWPIADFRFLSIIFIVQWVVLWCLIYFLLSGNYYRLLPWALLLGGGSYFTVGKNSGELIGDNGPWTVFMTTIWIPQRTAMFGACAILAALRVFLFVYERLKTIPMVGEGADSQVDPQASREIQFLLAVCGLILGLSPLAHTHFFMVAVLFISGCLALRVLYLKSWKPLTRKFTFSCLKAFCLPLALALLSLPWILGKAPTPGTVGPDSAHGMGKIIFGWVTGEAMNGPWDQTLMASAKMWVNSAPFWFACMLAVLFLSFEWILFMLLFGLFLVFNFVQLAFWEWDQIKIFIGLYIVFLALWASMKPVGSRGRVLFFLQVVSLSLSIPAVMELRGIYRRADLFGVYSKEEVENAEKIRNNTPPRAILQAKPDHNTLVTLTGRRLFYGYEGTLSSHGLDYLKRKTIMSSLDRIAHCHSEQAGDPATAAYCPDYVVWTSREKEFWSGQNLSGQYQSVIDNLLYKVRGP